MHNLPTASSQILINATSPDVKKSSYVDSLTHYLRNACVEYQMQQLNQLIHKIHSSLSDQAFLEIFEFVRSIYPDENSRDSASQINRKKYNQYHSSTNQTIPGCAKIPLLQLYSDFNAQHRSQLLELLQNRIQTELDFVCVEITSLNSIDESMLSLGRRHKLFDKVIQELKTKCTQRLQYNMGYTFVTRHKSEKQKGTKSLNNTGSNENNKANMISLAKLREKRKNGNQRPKIEPQNKQRYNPRERQNFATEHGVHPIVHDLSIKSIDTSSSAMIKKLLTRLPGSKTNPIHPELDSFMQKFEQNNVPKNIALMINSADNAQPALLQELIHTLQKYCEYKDLKLVILMPRTSEQFPLISAQDDFLLCKSFQLPTCAGLGSKILQSIQMTENFPLFLCGQAFNQILRMFKSYYGSLTSF